MSSAMSSEAAPLETHGDSFHPQPHANPDTAPKPQPQATPDVPADAPPPKSRLYTRKGDAGWSSLYNEEPLRKWDPIYEAIGGVNELNSAILTTLLAVTQVGPHLRSHRRYGNSAILTTLLYLPYEAIGGMATPLYLLHYYTCRTQYTHYPCYAYYCKVWTSSILPSASHASSYYRRQTTLRRTVSCHHSSSSYRKV